MSDEILFVIENGKLTGCKSKNRDVVIPNGVTCIGAHAFTGCRTLSSVVVPDSVTDIEEYAFSARHKLTKVLIGKNVTRIEPDAFFDCCALTEFSVASSNKAYSSVDGVLFNKDKTSLIRFPPAFSGTYTIPRGVTHIEDAAFSGCCAAKVIIPDGITKIENRTFDGCKVLTSIQLPRNLTIIERAAFRNCLALERFTVPEGVTSIGAEAFGGCSSLTSIIVPDSVTNIGGWAFRGCNSLREFVVPQNDIKTIVYHLFGEMIPFGIIRSLYPAMSDGMLKQFVLNKEIWSKLDDATQAEIFLSRQSKTLTSGYAVCIPPEQLKSLGNAVLERLAGEHPSAKDRMAASTFLSLFSLTAPADLRKKLQTAVENTNATGKRSKSTSRTESRIGSGEADNVVINVQQIAVNAMKADGISNTEAELTLLYGITLKELPVLKASDGTTLPANVLAWLLIAHEKAKGQSFGKTELGVAYEKPGLRPEVERILSLLDDNSLQKALTLLSCHLQKYQNTKKKNLCFPICRYMNETGMAELTKRAPGWRTSASGDNASPLREFRSACLYSETRSAMLFAERYHELDKYAELRGTDADTIRDLYLSDVGLNEQGEKTYDLGNQTVTARLQKDLSFLIELPDGKTVKSLPKKGANPEKYETANGDFAGLKKVVKKVLKSRGSVLFEDFLSGRTRDAGEWQTSYLHNPLLRKAAELIVWAQEEKTFTLSGSGAIDSAEKPYSITDKKIKVAHPMEMTADDITAWQKYFTAHGLKQPFPQVWEPVRKGEDIKEDRYADCMIPYYRFLGQTKHGIIVEDYDFHNEINIGAKGCRMLVERIDWGRHEINMEDRFEVRSFSFKEYNRQVNHIVAYFDRVTVWDRVRKDDLAVMDLMSSFTLAQIMEFIAAAQEAKATNVLSALLEYKNANFADYDPMAEFTLEW
ncbi:MAG: leucine-rich repeat protein [Oscillospiraceae bacterium]|nr:leucine-rich repeat protein [Oscillospiraceae bacterium]